MANWWDEDETVKDEGVAVPVAPSPPVAASKVQSQGNNWWDEDETVGSSPAHVEVDDTGTEVISNKDYVNSLDDPEALQKRITANNDQRNMGASLPTERVDDLTKSSSELYDGIRKSPKYAKLNEYENSLAHTIGPNVTTTNQQTGASNTWNPWTGSMPDDIKSLKDQRDAELNRSYTSTGQKDVLPTPFGAEEIRTQPIMTPNPDFDATQKPSPTNPSEITKKYMIDPPDRIALVRMGYQVMKNIAGGVADFVNDGVTKGKLNLTGEGDAGRVLPDTVTDIPGEKFATDVTTFVLGPKMITQTVKEGALLAHGGALTLAGKVGGMMSPEAVQTARTIYDGTLKATGSAEKAFAASNKYVQKAIVGSAIGVESAIVAPNNSEGLIPAETIRKYMPNLSPESARDMSFLLDTPMIGGTLTSLGGLYNTIKEKVVAPSLGGLRNLQFAGLSGNKMIGMSEKAVGLKTALWLDPNLKSAAPEVAAVRLKVLGDAFKNNAIKNAKIGAAGKQIDLDSTTAFVDMASNYYRMAYANLKDQLGPENFEKWVAQQANESSARLVELRTKSMGDTNVSSKLGKLHGDIESLFDEGGEALTKDGMLNAQMNASNAMGGKVLTDISDADTRFATAQREFDTAKKLSDNAITDDDEFRVFLGENNSPLGSKRSSTGVVDKISEKTYKALTGLKKDTDEAYAKLAESGAEGDPVSFLDIVKGDVNTVPLEQTTGKAALDKTLSADPEAKAMYEKLGGPLKSKEAEQQTHEISDPFLRKLAESVESDPSFGNMYNNVRVQIQDRITRLRAANTPDEAALDTLYKLRENIEKTQMDYVAANGDDMKALVEDAKGKYVKLRSAFYDHDELERITDKGLKRMQSDPAFGSKTPVGPDGQPQNLTNYQLKLSRHVKNALEGNEGEIFSRSLTRATKIGGQDISPELNDFYATKALANLGKKLSVDAPQDLNTLQQSLEGIIEPMEALKSPMLNKFKGLMTKVQTLQNTTKDKQALFETVKQETQKIQDEAKSSLFYKFVYDGKVPKDPTAAGLEMKKMFNAPDRVNKMRDLLAKADGLGDQAQTVKEALQSTYMDNLADRLISKRATGLGEMEDGVLQTQYKINETNYKKIFSEGSPDLEVMKVIYKDNPQIVTDAKELADLYVNSSKTTPHAKDTLGGNAVSPEMDPTKGLGTAINLLFGRLNRKGAKIGALVGPSAAKDMGKVAEANGAAVVAFLVDPREASRLIGLARKGIIDNESGAAWNKLVARGLIRATSNQINVEDEMGRLK